MGWKFKALCAIPVRLQPAACFLRRRAQKKMQPIYSCGHERGAVAIASESAPPTDLDAKVVWVRVPESRKSLAIAAANFFAHPAKSLQLIAVTGTNGKTTTTSLIDSVLRVSGAKTGMFGTIAYHTPLGKYPRPIPRRNRWIYKGCLGKFVMKAENSR